MPATDRDMRFIAMLPTLEKAVKFEPDGSFFVAGLASDPGLDLQNERVDQESVLAHAPYLEQWGKLDWDHGKLPIGEITEVRRITPAEAAQEFGKKIEGDGTYVKARVYPLGQRDLAPDDVRQAHYHADIGAKMGFSLEGSTKRVGGVAYPTAIYRVALCPQPVNTNSVAVPLAKSMAEAMAVWEAGQPDVMIEYPELEEAEADDLAKAQLEKSGLATNTATDEAALEGGASFRKQSLKPRTEHTGWHCDKCGSDCGADDTLCKCGAGKPGKALTKGLLALAKSRVKAHTRTVGGKLVQVGEYEDKRKHDVAEKYQSQQTCLDCDKTSRMKGKPGPCPHCGGNTRRTIRQGGE